MTGNWRIEVDLLDVFYEVAVLLCFTEGSRTEGGQRTVLDEGCSSNADSDLDRLWYRTRDCDACEKMIAAWRTPAPVNPRIGY